MLQISKYIVIINLLFLWGISSVTAQRTSSQRSDHRKYSHNKEKDKLKEKPDSTKFWNGFRVDVDAASVVQTLAGSKQTYSMESSIQFDLKHRYYPVFELGIGGADKTSNNDVSFKTDSHFERVGIDFNLIKRKSGANASNNLFLAGFRLGMSHFKYDINNLSIDDDYWGTKEPINYNNLSSSSFWYEVDAGIRVEIIKNIYIGWTVRYKKLLGSDKSDSGEPYPWYIPGFGKYDTSNWGFNYTIGYKF